MSEQLEVPDPGIVVFGSWFDGHLDTVPKPFELPWPAFCQALYEQFNHRDDKYGNGGQGPTRAGHAPGFSLARFVDRAPDAGGPANRDKRHVDVLSGVVLDFDKNYDPASVFERVDGLVWFAYTTFSHAEAQPKWRLVVPFASPIPGSAYKAVRAWLVARINGRGLRNEADAAASSTANFYFGPGCPEARADLAALKVGEGSVLEVPPLSEFKRGLPETRILGDKIDLPWLKAKMQTHKDDRLRVAFRAVLKGKPFAEHGERDALLLRMCGAVAGWAVACDPEQLALLFAPSLEAMAALNPDDPPPDVDNAADKIARSQASLVAKSRDEIELRVADAEEDAPIVTAPVSDEIATQDARASGLADSDELRQRLLLRHGNAFWMWRTDLGTWIGPLTEPEAQGAARKDLLFFPGIAIGVRKVDGGMRQKVLAELFSDYGERADRVSYAYEPRPDPPKDGPPRDVRDLPRAQYDPVKRHLTLVGAPRRPGLEPVFDPLVDQWLRAIGGAKVEKLHDWIAGLTWHKRPSSVLFIEGDPGIGKGLLARGLARVWDVDAATDMANIAGQFNDDLLRCPLVRIDEGPWTDRVDVTKKLREVVTQSSRMVNPKHLKLVELVGVSRFIVTANNFDIFVSKNALTPTDREALAERFLYLKPDKASNAAAQALLAGMTPDEIEALALDNRIAAHALWLADERTLQQRAPGRFIAAGDKADRFATKIITEDQSYGSWVVQWLAHWLSAPLEIEKEVGQAKAYRGGGKAMVSPEAIYQTFDRVMRNKRGPEFLQISNALLSLSTGIKTDFPNGKGEGYDVLVDEVIAWAQDKCFGDVKKIRAATQQEHGKVLNMGGKK